MSTQALKLSFSVGLEATTTNVDASHLTLVLLSTMVAATSLRTVTLAENRRWYHCKCVRVKRLRQKEE